MTAPTPARIIPFTRVRFEDRARKVVSLEYGPFESVRISASEVRVDLAGELLARREGEIWRIVGAEPAAEFFHVLVWDGESELFTVDLPLDEEQALERMLDKCRQVDPETSRADIMRAALRYTASLSPKQIYQAVQAMREKDRVAALKDLAKETASVAPRCGSCDMLVQPGSRRCNHCGALTELE